MVVPTIRILQKWGRFNKIFGVKLIVKSETAIVKFHFLGSTSYDCMQHNSF